MEKSRKKCLITGASGLIGASLVDIAVESYDVYALTRRAVDFRDPKIKNIVLDLSNSAVYSSLPDKVDVVVHLAQSSHFREFPNRATEIFGVNVESTVNLLDYARRAGAKNFILASSGGVYGYSEKAFSETATVSGSVDLGFYLSTRVAAEVLSESYRSFFDVKILRYFFVYGPSQRSDMLIPRLISSVQSGKEITLQGEQGLRINPIYVGDAARATLAAMNQNGSFKVNIAGDEIFSLLDIAGAIGKHLRANPVFKNDNRTKPTDLLGDNSVMRSSLCVPETSFEAGLGQMLAPKYPDNC